MSEETAQVRWVKDLIVSTSRKQGRNVRDIHEFKTLLEDSEYLTYRGREDAFWPVGIWKEGGCAPLDCVSVGDTDTWFAATDIPNTAWKQVGELLALSLGRLLPSYGSLLVQSGADKGTIDRWLAASVFS